MRQLPGRPASVRQWINNKTSNVLLAVEKNPSSIGSQTQSFSLHSLANSTKMVRDRGRDVCRKMLETFGWQLAVPSASRRCPDSSLIHIVNQAQSAVLKETLKARHVEPVADSATPCKPSLAHPSHYPPQAASGSCTSSRPQPFWWRPPCTNAQALWAQVMAADHQGCSCGANGCLPSNSVPGSQPRVNAASSSRHTLSRCQRRSGYRQSF